MSEYHDIEALIEKLEKDQIHIVVFGKVSTGKSSLLNALAGKEVFSTSPLHGETKKTKNQIWSEYQDQLVHLIDTPGTDEWKGESREKIAIEAAESADIILFVLDSDISRSELNQLKIICSPSKPVIIALNKSDLYTQEESASLLQSIRNKTNSLIPPEHVIATAANPNPQLIITLDTKGNEHQRRHTPTADIEALKKNIWQILEKDGKTLSALNASIFAGKISDDIAQRITQVRKKNASKIIQTYCISKGIGVACNPVPVADLLVAASVDTLMIRQLSTLYGIPLKHTEATKLVVTIMAQLALLMGAVWSVNLLSSALKTVSIGLSTTITATAQGSLAYYATYLVGKIAERYFAQGKSWGELGPKKVAKEILKSIDRNSVLIDARSEILNRLKRISQ